MRLSELLVCCLNDPDRIVIIDHGNCYPYNHRYIVDVDKFGCRHVKSFLFETINNGRKTLFIELKGEKK